MRLSFTSSAFLFSSVLLLVICRDSLCYPSPTSGMLIRWWWKNRTAANLRGTPGTRWICAIGCHKLQQTFYKLMDDNFRNLSTSIAPIIFLSYLQRNGHVWWIVHICIENCQITSCNVTSWASFTWCYFLVCWVLGCMNSMLTNLVVFPGKGNF